MIEAAYLQKQLLVLCATATLAAGVNLPAHTVIFKGLQIGRGRLQPTIFHQMAGRAGRTGMASAGEVYVLATRSDAEVEEAHTLLLAPPQAALSRIAACDLPEAWLRPADPAAAEAAVRQAAAQFEARRVPPAAARRRRRLAPAQHRARQLWQLRRGHAARGSLLS